MTPEARRASLLDHLMACGQAQVDDLATLLGVSRMTVHRDLDLLASRRIVRKVRGGATVRPSVVCSPACWSVSPSGVFSSGATIAASLPGTPSP